jgi:iron complex outermembrane receptor protein
MYFSLRNLDTPHLSDAQKAYSQVDASLRLSAPGGSKFPWHAELYVRNVGDVRAKTWGGIGGPQQTFSVGSYNDPRMFGLRVGTEW